MSKCRVQKISTDDLERSITVAVDGVRIEYFLGDRYHQTLVCLDDWIRDGWTNYAVSQLTSRSVSIETIRKKGVRKMLNTIDSQSTPSKEYPWTVIAPAASSGLTYRGKRQWFKTEEDAKAFAADVFEDADKKNFELCIVQCINVVAPKAQIELTSRW